jgi:hypothetical protein
MHASYSFRMEGWGVRIALSPLGVTPWDERTRALVDTETIE